LLLWLDKLNLLEAESELLIAAGHWLVGLVLVEAGNVTHVFVDSVPLAHGGPWTVAVTRHPLGSAMICLAKDRIALAGLRIIRILGLRVVALVIEPSRVSTNSLRDVFSGIRAMRCSRIRWLLDVRQVSNRIAARQE